MSTRLVTFVLDRGLYGVDVAAVREVLRGLPTTRVPLAPAGLAGLVNLRGEVLATLDLRQRLGLDPREDGAEPVLVVTHGRSEPDALLVDRIGEVVDVTDLPLLPPPETLDGPARPLIVGCYPLPDQLLLALDVERLAPAEALTTLGGHP